MTKHEKIVAVFVLTYFLFGFFQFWEFGSFIAPFLLNEVIVCLVSFYFFATTRPFQYLLLLFSLGAVCQLVGSRFFIESFFSYENTAKLINLVVWDYFKISAYVLFSSLLIYQLTRLRNNFPTYLWILLLLGSVFYCASWILAQDFFTSLATVWIALVACVYLRNKKEENPTDSLLLLFALQGLLDAFVLVLYCLS